jgi:hypothetical protein
MATLYVTEFDNPRAGAPNIGVVMMPPNNEQVVAITGASVSSAAFSLATKLIRVHADAVCSIVVAVAPTATITKMRMIAGQTEYFEVQPTYKIAVIANT